VGGHSVPGEGEKLICRRRAHWSSLKPRASFNPSLTLRARVRVGVDHTCPATKPLGSPTDRPPINSAFRRRPCAKRRSVAAGLVRRETMDRPAYRCLNNRTVSDSG
jgi:hypothetical protein